LPSVKIKIQDETYNKFKKIAKDKGDIPVTVLVKIACAEYADNNFTEKKPSIGFIED
jgi:hypothetical protein